MVTRRIFFKALAVLVSTLLALVVAEFALRAFLPGTKPAEDPVLLHRALPGGDRDERGFRNAGAFTKADIVVLGDSQTEGNNASREEAWPQVLGKLSGKTVYQMALGGWAAPQYRVLFDDALALNPDTVLVAFYVGNDLLEATHVIYTLDAWESYRSDSFSPTPAGDVPADIRIALNHGVGPGSLGNTLLKARTWLRDHLRLYAFVGDATRTLRERLNLTATDEAKHQRIISLTEDTPDLGLVFEDPKIGTILSPSYRLQTVNLDDQNTAEGWRITKALFQEMLAKADAHGAGFAFVIIPTKEFVYLSWLEGMGKEIPASFTVYQDAERLLFSAFRAWCRDGGFVCIDSSSALAEALGEGVRVYPDSLDGHPLPAGYRVIAETVHKNLYGE